MDNKNLYMRYRKEILIIILLLALLAASFFIDQMVLGFVRDINIPILVSIFTFITFFGETIPLIILTGIVAIVLFSSKKKVSGLVLAMMSTSVLVYLIKFFSGRLRPFEFLNVSSIVSTQWSSFPSGHAAAFFCLLAILNSKFPQFKILFWSAAILVALSRVYLQVHYLSDVIAGALLGYGIGLLFLSIETKYDMI